MVHDTLPTPVRLEDEDRIVWLDDRPFPFVREDTWLAGTRTRGPGRLLRHGCRLVAYVVLKPDARNIGSNGQFRRRFWYVREDESHYAGADGLVNRAPHEGVLPGFVRVGAETRHADLTLAECPLPWPR